MLLLPEFGVRRIAYRHYDSDLFVRWPQLPCLPDRLPTPIYRLLFGALHQLFVPDASHFGLFLDVDGRNVTSEPQVVRQCLRGQWATEHVVRFLFELLLARRERVVLANAMDPTAWERSRALLS